MITDNVTDFTGWRVSSTDQKSNGEPIQCLEWTTADNGKKRKDWDLYIRETLFVFCANDNQDLSKSHFSLQYVEPASLD